MAKHRGGESFYREDDFRGNINSDLGYISSVLTEMEVGRVLKCLEDSESLGLQEELADFDICGDKVKIWTLCGRPDSDDYSKWPSFIIDKLSLVEIVKYFIQHKAKQTPILYLMLLSNNSIVIQTSLYEKQNILMPLSFQKYVVTQLKGKVYEVFGFTDSEIRPLSLLIEFSDPRLFLKKIYFKSSRLEVKQVGDLVVITKMKNTSEFVYDLGKTLKQCLMSGKNFMIKKFQKYILSKKMMEKLLFENDWKSDKA